MASLGDYSSWCCNTLSMTNFENPLYIRASKNYMIYTTLLKHMIESEGSANAVAIGKNIDTLVLLIETMRVISNCSSKISLSSLERDDSNLGTRFDPILKVKFFKREEDKTFQGFVVHNYDNQRISSIKDATVNGEDIGEFNLTKDNIQTLTNGLNLIGVKGDIVQKSKSLVFKIPKLIMKENCKNRTVKTKRKVKVPNPIKQRFRTIEKGKKEILKIYKNCNRIWHRRYRKENLYMLKLKYYYPMLEKDLMQISIEKGEYFRYIPVNQYNLKKRGYLYLRNNGLTKHKKVGCCYTYYDKDEGAYLTSKPIVTPYYRMYNVDKEIKQTRKDRLSYYINVSNGNRGEKRIPIGRLCKFTITTGALRLKSTKFNKIKMRCNLKGKSFFPEFLGREVKNKMVMLRSRVERVNKIKQ